MIVLGIDPGLNGALAVVTIRERLPILLAAIDVPLIQDGTRERVDALAVMEFIREYNPQRAFSERAQAMPSAVMRRPGATPSGEWKGQGASSALNYGRAVGYLECCVHGLLIPLKRIEAVAWKKTNGLLKQDKEASRQRALRLFSAAPAVVALLARKKDQHRAEAALIAWHGLMLVQSNAL